jgi:peptidoglycan/xylan/chitin deacetylase (PgdA/CDA1 family)
MAVTRGVPILMYHQVAPSAPVGFEKYVVTPAAFAGQMRWLALARYTPVTIDALVRYWRGRGGPWPAHPVVITFDDGFADVLAHAVPVLRARRFTAVFYLVSGLMGSTSCWLQALRGVELPLMSWGDARELERAGFQCGAHGARHWRLTDLSPAGCQAELVECRRALIEELGHEVTDLAYPFGAHDAPVRAAAAAAGFRSACSVNIGLARADDDPLALRRVPVNGGDSLLDFASRLRTGHAIREAIAGKLERWRTAGPRTRPVDA